MDYNSFMYAAQMDLQMNIYWSFRSGGFEPQIRDIVMLGLPGGCVNPAQTRRDYITGLVYSSRNPGILALGRLLQFFPSTNPIPYYS